MTIGKGTLVWAVLVAMIAFCALVMSIVVGEWVDALGWLCACCGWTTIVILGRAEREDET